MKKLIIALMAMAMAVVANAAQVKWTVGNVYVPDTTTKAENYLVYFVSSADYSYANATADLIDGDAAFVTTYGQASALTSSTGMASATITSEAGNSETWTGYLVVFNAATVADATLAYITVEGTKTTGATGQAANLAFTSNAASQSAANWHAVPEPTSGLLMLVGLAGLALRRRCA